MKRALGYNITDGLGKAAYSEKVMVAGMQGTCQLSTNEDDTENRANTQYAVEFCGFFPANNAQYTIIISINKLGLPVSGGLMAGDVFREIVDYIINQKINQLSN